MHRQMDSHFRHGFCCPEVIPGPEPRFSSPTSPLPPQEHKELEQCIAAANDLLRTLGNPRDPQNTQSLRLRFRALRGLLARVVVECQGVEHVLIGCLKDAGKDFLQLDQVGEDVFIPFGRMCTFARNGDCDFVPHHQQDLLEIDPCLRRDLILRFGEVVSCNPELIQVFFGLRLNQRLLSFIGCPVRVERESCGGQPLVGVLCGVEEAHLEVQTDSRLQLVNFNDLCFIHVGALIRRPDPPEPPEPPHPD